MHSRENANLPMLPTPPSIFKLVNTCYTPDLEIGKGKGKLSEDTFQCIQRCHLFFFSLAIAPDYSI